MAQAMIVIEDEQGVVGRLLDSPEAAALSSGTWNRGALYLRLAQLRTRPVQEVTVRAMMRRVERRQAQTLTVRRALVSEGRKPWRSGR